MDCFVVVVAVIDIVNTLSMLIAIGTLLELGCE